VEVYNIAMYFETSALFRCACK